MSRRTLSADAKRWLSRQPVYVPSDALALDRLRWALGDALPESQRAAFPPLSPLAECGRPVVAEVIAKVAGKDVPLE